MAPTQEDPEGGPAAFAGSQCQEASMIDTENHQQSSRDTQTPEGLRADEQPANNSKSEDDQRQADQQADLKRPEEADDEKVSLSRRCPLN